MFLTRVKTYCKTIWLDKKEQQTQLQPQQGEKKNPKKGGYKLYI